LLRVPGPATLEVTVSQPGDRGVSPPGGFAEEGRGSTGKDAG